MSKKYLFLLVLLILLLPLNFGFGFFLGAKSQMYKLQNLGPYFLPKEAIVSKVIDGDTIEISPLIQISQINPISQIPTRSVRLLGIGSPEAGQPKYKEAKEFNESLVLGKKITLEYDTPQNDKYGRILAWVWLDGKLINQEMINAGHAIPFTMEGQKLKYNLSSPN
jgi:endonuclease YncB( thermonuclease family)